MTCRRSPSRSRVRIRLPFSEENAAIHVVEEAGVIAPEKDGKQNTDKPGKPTASGKLEAEEFDKLVRISKVPILTNHFLSNIPSLEKALFRKRLEIWMTPPIFRRDNQSSDFGGGVGF